MLNNQDRAEPAGQSPRTPPPLALAPGQRLAVASFVTEKTRKCPVRGR